jgi:hypothetical protein
MHRPLAALACALLLAAAAPGTTLSRETTADLIALAERVCCVAVDGVEARRDPRSGFVFTHVRLRLLEDLKGAGDGAVFELRIPGGKADGVETVAPGMPKFQTGREAVLLLGKKNREGFPILLQGTGGVLPLRTAESGRRCLCVRVTGLKELEGSPEVALDSFRTAVERIVREQREKAGR